MNPSCKYGGGRKEKKDFYVKIELKIKRLHILIKPYPQGDVFGVRDADGSALCLVLQQLLQPWAGIARKAGTRTDLFGRVPNIEVVAWQMEIQVPGIVGLLEHFGSVLGNILVCLSPLPHPTTRVLLQNKIFLHNKIFLYNNL